MGSILIAIAALCNYQGAGGEYVLQCHKYYVTCVDKYSSQYSEAADAKALKKCILEKTRLVGGS